MSRKGPARTEPYAARIRKMQGIYDVEYRKAVVNNCIDLVVMASAIALNEEFGFGKERITRFTEAANAVLMEYRQYQADTDDSYARGVFERRYKQIMEVEE